MTTNEAIESLFKQRGAGSKLGYSRQYWMNLKNRYKAGTLTVDTYWMLLERAGAVKVKEEEWEWLNY